ncbi:MAG: RNA methyltransferase [Chitinophagales bacterium]|nr:RNA methyltransferase [Chitinophagales bacterium]
MTPERLANITRVLNNRQPDLAIVMENIEDPHNIFAVMRTCDAVGVQDVYVVNTKFRAHKKHGNASSSSAAKWLTLHQFDTLEDCIEVVKSRYDKLYAGYLGEGSQSIYDMDLTESAALVFGNEHFGVTEEMLEHCDGRFIIPQVGMIRSLNISVACAVTLYEARRQRAVKGYYDDETPRLPEPDRQVLKEKWSRSRHKQQ